MSVLTADVIKSAYRRAGILAAGSTGIPSLSTPNSAIGLELLNGMYLKWVNGGLFGTFDDYYLASGNYEAKEFERVYQASNASVVTFPTTVVDVVTGDTRAPRNKAVIIVINATTNVPVIKIFDAMLAKWVAAYGLTIAVETPLGDQFSEVIKNNLALELCNDFGYPVPAGLERRAAIGRLGMASKTDVPRKGNMVEYY